MQEMVEPDRTIMIVSIIALVIIWGSVAYHKFVQDGGAKEVSPAFATPSASDSVQTESPGGQTAQTAPAGQGQKSGSKKRKKNRR